MTQFDDQPFDDEPAQEETAKPVHEPTPADCQKEPPTADGLNHMGYFRRPAGADQPEGSTIVIKSHATDDNLRNHEREGVMQFLGWAPAEGAVASETVDAPRKPVTTPDEWQGKRFDVAEGPPEEE